MVSLNNSHPSIGKINITRCIISIIIVRYLNLCFNMCILQNDPNSDDAWLWSFAFQSFILTLFKHVYFLAEPLESVCINLSIMLLFKYTKVNQWTILFSFITWWKRWHNYIQPDVKWLRVLFDSWRCQQNGAIVRDSNDVDENIGALWCFNGNQYK